MKRSCSQSFAFDPLRDFQEVEQGLSINITDALRTGVVSESDKNLSYNSIDDPDRVVGRVSDIFDAIEAERAINKHGRKARIASNTETTSPATEGAAAPPAGN